MYKQSPIVFPVHKNVIKSSTLSVLEQGRRDDFDIGEACLTSAEGASVKGESTRGVSPLSLWGGGVGGGGGGGGVGGLPRKV